MSPDNVVIITMIILITVFNGRIYKMSRDDNFENKDNLKQFCEEIKQKIYTT